MMVQSTSGPRPFVWTTQEVGFPAFSFAGPNGPNDLDGYTPNRSRTYRTCGQANSMGNSGPFVPPGPSGPANQFNDLPDQTDRTAWTNGSLLAGGHRGGLRAPTLQAGQNFQRGFRRDGL